MRERLLFHGTKIEYIVSILKTFIDIGRASKEGKGFYLSDLLDILLIYGNRLIIHILKLNIAIKVLQKNKKKFQKMELELLKLNQEEKF